MKTTQETLRQEREALEKECWFLECSDDSLFSNANGKFERYKTYKQRIREIDRELSACQRT